MVIRALAALAACAATGCALITDSFLTNDFSGDPAPINVDTSSGAIVVGLRPTGGPDTVAVLDLLSPFTTSDPDPFNPLDRPRITDIDLALLGAVTPIASAPPDLGNGAITPDNLVARAVFPDRQLITVHACDGNAANADKNCHIGDTGQTVFQSVLGADALAGDAIRLRLADRQLFVLPDVAGSDSQRALNCDAVFGSPYRGGGTLVIAGTELPFGNRRIALSACLGPHPELTPQANRGTDALLVVSTSIGISILGESTYARYRLTHPGAPAPDGADHSVYLPSGIVHGQLGQLESLSIVGPSADNTLSPCRQIYAHRVLAPHKLTGDCPTTQDGKAFDCPCEDGSLSCTVPAMIELFPAGGIPVLVVADTDPTLQALRAELRPDQPEVDGILGTGALTTGEYDVDYPHDRMLARCRGGACCTRPEFLKEYSDQQFAQINRCLATQAACVNEPVPTSF